MSVRNLRVSDNGATGEVQSSTDSSKWYNVVKSKDGEYRCTCPYNFIKRVECHHIREMDSEVWLYNQKPTEPRMPGLFVAKIMIGYAHYAVTLQAYSRSGAVIAIRKRYPFVKIDLPSVMEYTANNGIIIEYKGAF